MRCLSVRQPWASLIVAGHKTIENRTWATTHRGPLLIHAAKRPVLDADTHGLLTRDEIAALPRGGIIGVVNVVDCVDASDDPWFMGPIGWILQGARALPFEACAGRLGLFSRRAPSTRRRPRAAALPLFR